MSKIRVFSFNIWTDGRADGGACSGQPRCFAVRRELIRKNFPAYDADLVGFQETMPAQRQWLIDTFTEYQVCGIGRDKDLLGESNVVMFKKDKFDLVDLDTFWLSDTPHIPGTRFATDQSTCPRICTTVTLRSKEDGKLLRHYNTHLDHVGQIAQAQGITMILNRMASDFQKWAMPVVLTGDMNVTPDNVVYQSIVSFAGLHAPLEDKTADMVYSFHANHPTDHHCKIDYVFSTLPSAETKSIQVNDADENGVTMSDHYPVGAVLEL